MPLCTIHRSLFHAVLDWTAPTIIRFIRVSDQSRIYAGVAQLAEASGLEPGCWEFESPLQHLRKKRSKIMIMYKPDENIVHTKAEVLVNAVNCVGVPGAGLARQIATRYPLATRKYMSTCKRGEMTLGKVLVTTNKEQGPKYIVHFPTKGDWRYRAEYEYIKLGLSDLRKLLEKYKPESIAIPKLGCGLGGLNWKIVHPMILEALSGLETEIWIYGEP